MIKIARIDGDGIGKEVTEAGVAVLESLDLNFDFIEAEAGRECFDKNGTTIPEETIKIARNAKQPFLVQSLPHLVKKVQ